MMSPCLLVKSSFNTWLNPNKLYPGYYNLPSYLLQKLDVFQALLVVVESPWLKQSIYLFQMTVVDSHYVPMISPCLLVKSPFCCWSHLIALIPTILPSYSHFLVKSQFIPRSWKPRKCSAILLFAPGHLWLPKAARKSSLSSCCPLPYGWRCLDRGPGFET